MKFIPHAYQSYCIDRLTNETQLALFLDCGLGKSVISLTAIQTLKYDMWLVRKALVIAPKRVAESTWTNEASKWSHLSDLKVVVVSGTPERRKQLLASQADVYVLGRDNLKWLVDLQRNRCDFDMVVVDELSGFKGASTQRFKALRSVLPRIRRIVGLTGTPAPNGIHDLWAEIFLLDSGERLGRTLTGFRERYFNHNEYTHQFTPKAGAAELIQDKIKDICVSMKASDHLTLPDCVTVDAPVVLDAKSQELYKRLERDMILEYAGQEIVAPNAAALSNKLLQLCSGDVYASDAPNLPVNTPRIVDGRSVIQIHTAKVEALLELLEGLNGDSVIVFYSYRHELERIKAAIPKHLRTRELITPQDEKAWNAGKVDVLLTHPASSAYGLNLQDGGHHMVWFGLTWSLQLYQQAVARLHRQGQPYPVIVHRLLVKDGLDEDVVRALDGKKDTQSALLEALRAKMNEVCLSSTCKEAS